MRAYFFGNMYLASIQQGIQAGHAVARMAAKYCPHPDEFIKEIDPCHVAFLDWAENHETMVLLNGGMTEHLLEFESFLEGSLDMPDVPRLSEHYDGYSPYPFASMEEEGIGDTISSIGLVLPEHIYEGAKRKKRYKAMPDNEYVLWRDHKTLLFDGEEVVYNDWQIELMKRISKCRLAI